MYTEALAGRGETWRWMSAAAGASGDWVLAGHCNQSACLAWPAGVFDYRNQFWTYNETSSRFVDRMAFIQ